MDSEEILKQAGFVNLPKRGLWVSRDRRMAFSSEALSDHDENWVQERLGKTVEKGDFLFWFTAGPAEKFGEFAVSVLAELGLSNLRGAAPYWHMSIGR
jgi:hypothetical protein